MLKTLVSIDHIVPLANKGKDAEENFAVTHESCNKSKQDSDLRFARILHKLEKIQDGAFQKEGKSASLKHVSDAFGGSEFEFRYKLENGKLLYSLSECGNNDIRASTIFTLKGRAHFGRVWWYLRASACADSTQP